MTDDLKWIEYPSSAFDAIPTEWWVSGVPGGLEIWGPGSHITQWAHVPVILEQYFIYRRPNNSSYHYEAGPFPTLEAAKLAYRMLPK
jgi:hypothetical protein